jgi:hypothetical protein
MGLARDQERNSGRIGNETREALQETGCFGMAQESSYSEWNDGSVREARAPLESSGRF